MRNPNNWLIFRVKGAQSLFLEIYRRTNIADALYIYNNCNDVIKQLKGGKNARGEKVQKVS